MLDLCPPECILLCPEVPVPKQPCSSVPFSITLSPFVLFPMMLFPTGSVRMMLCVIVTFTYGILLPFWPPTEFPVPSHFAYKALLHYTNMDTVIEHWVIWNKIKSWSLEFFCKEFLKAANVLSNTHLHQTFWPHSWKYLSPRLHFPKSLATFQSNVCLSRGYFLIVQ